MRHRKSKLLLELMGSICIKRDMTDTIRRLYIVAILSFYGYIFEVIHASLYLDSIVALMMYAR